MTIHLDLPGDTPMALETGEVARELVGYEMAARQELDEVKRIRNERLAELAKRLVQPDGLEYGLHLILSLAAYGADIALAGAAKAGMERPWLHSASEVVELAATTRRNLNTAH